MEFGFVCAAAGIDVNNELMISMKPINLCLASLVLCGVAGCAAKPMGTRLEPVGPSPAAVARAADMGNLQVYSARELAPLNVEMQLYVASTEFSPEDNSLQRDFLHTSAHGNYSIYDAQGKFIKRVSNAKGTNDSSPTQVKLAPGSYLVEAVTEEYDTYRHPVIVPVEIKPGLATVVHLDGTWNSEPTTANADMVKFPNGEIIGWHSTNVLNLTPQLKKKQLGKRAYAVRIE